MLLGLGLSDLSLLNELFDQLRRLDQGLLLRRLGCFQFGLILRGRCHCGQSHVGCPQHSLTLSRHHLVTCRITSHRAIYVPEACRLAPFCLLLLFESLLEHGLLSLEVFLLLQV